MKKGIVMEKRRRFMIVMTNRGEFEKTKLQSDKEVGEEIDYNPLITYHFSTLYKNRTYSIPAAAVIMFVFFLTLMPFLNADKVYGTVMIDMNPSIEISVDKHYGVINATGYNSKGIEILNAIDRSIRGLSLNEATSLVIEEGNELGYLSEENYVYISSPFIVSNQDLWGEDYDQWIGQMQDQYSVNFISLTVDQDVFQQAKELSLSPAKYMLLQQARETGIDLDVVELNSTAIQDIEKDAGVELEKIVSSEKMVVSHAQRTDEVIEEVSGEQPETSDQKDEEMAAANTDDKKKEKGSKEENEEFVPPGKNKNKFTPPGQAKDKSKDESHPSNNNPGKNKDKEFNKGDGKHPSELKGDNRNRNNNNGRGNGKNNGKGNSNSSNDGTKGNKGNR